MNKHLSYAIGALVCAASVEIWAQTPAPQNPQPAPATARRYVVIGCVSRVTPSAPSTAAAPPQFLITDNRGDTPVVYRLDGDANDLTFHVGHTVEVSGPLTVTPASGSNPGTLVLKVSALAYLTTTCKSPKS